MWIPLEPSKDQKKTSSTTTEISGGPTNVTLDSSPPPDNGENRLFSQTKDCQMPINNSDIPPAIEAPFAANIITLFMPCQQRFPVDIEQTFSETMTTLRLPAARITSLARAQRLISQLEAQCRARLARLASSLGLGPLLESGPEAVATAGATGSTDVDEENDMEVDADADDADDAEETEFTFCEGDLDEFSRVVGQPRVAGNTNQSIKQVDQDEHDRTITGKSARAQSTSESVGSMYEHLNKTLSTATKQISGRLGKHVSGRKSAHIGMTKIDEEPGSLFACNGIIIASF
ncbi:unnamed protein product [Protopolystoma xenopodis]|uniref:Uncharacterized protein n=1 Tax=Protopolystoma xenopodis TaxID=117903 RepID=A0A3S4ZGF8_9PLAT|nr:unnamed protein product [Protopolystoma xenopodis]